MLTWKEKLAIGATVIVVIWWAVLFLVILPLRMSP